MNDSFNPNHIGDDSVPSTRMTTQSSPPSLAPKTAQRTSLGRRFQRALTGGPNRRFPGLHSPLGGTTSTSLLANRRLAFPIVALLAALAVGLLFLLPGGPLHAQDAGTIDYAENGTGSVATYTASDPEGAMVKWSLGGEDASDFMIDNGVLSFKKSPDYETPKGGTAGTSNTYEVMVRAADETRRVDPKAVTVNVTNVDEAGKVTLSARRPQTDTAFTAEVSDPDDNVADDKWQWAKAGSKNGPYRDIDNATSVTYTPEDADSNSYLRATVTYEDGEGEGKSAMMVSEFQSQRITGGNDAPAFDDDQDPLMAGDQDDANRSVVENTAAGKTIGSPVVATDDNGDTLTYTLTGSDAEHFDIDWGTGQILTKAKLDAENENPVLMDRDDNSANGIQLQVMVRATDPSGMPSAEPADTANSGTVTVMVTVTDVNEAPAVDGDAALTFNEVAGDITVLLDTYMADDPDAGAPDSTWSVGGADGSKFNIGNEEGGNPGELKFKKKPDYEKPTDADTDNVYEVTVQASDGKKTGILKVMVTVLNEEEAGVVTLDKITPVVGIPVTAMLEDPDGGVSKLTWQWSIRDADAGAVEDVTATGDGNINGATSDTYKPKAGDVGGTLTATANYFDGQNALTDATKRTAGEGADNAVELDTRNKPPVFGDEDPDTNGVQNTMATRKVEENTEALAGEADDDADDTDAPGDNVGAAVEATDTKADGLAETLTYSLGGTDAAKFRVRDNGQIEVAAGTKLNYETKDTYMVTVMARDPLGASASIPVTIMVTGLDEAPDVSGDEEADYAENGTGSVATYTASDPEGAMVKWSLGGEDASDFMIDNGVLSFKKSPDYETPKGGTAGTSNTYEVMVRAADETRRVDPKAVTVNVTNVDEAGKVTLSARRPQTDTAFTAEVSDPDDNVADDKWQWAKAGSKNGPYRDIDNATSVTYTPEDADSNSYLRATVTYEDGEGEGKSAMMVSEFQSQRITGGNDAPAFDDDQDPLMAGDQDDANRSVVENTAAGKTIGSPVVATDDNGDTLTYTLTGSDAEHFDIDWGTGQILTKAKLDAENENPVLMDRDDNSANGIQLQVMVRATDPSGMPSAEPADTANSGTVTVMVTVTDVNEAPAVDGDAALTFNEVAGDITVLLDTYMADDPDAGAPDSTWSVGGADGSKFNIGNEEGGNPGELKFKKKPDYEKPTDADTDNVYEVTVQASDGKKTGILKVMVTVLNEEEAGVVTLDKITPVVGIPVTAMLEDPDGGVSKLTWQWSIRDADAGAVEDVTATGDGNINGATSDTYKPKAGDVGGTLTATANYFDGQNALTDATKRTAGEGADNAVELDTRNKPPVFGDEDPDTNGVQNTMATRKVEENTEALAGEADDDADDTDAPGDNVGAAVEATDTKADGLAETLTYSLGGTDAAKFRVRDNGQIEVAAGTKLNYETKDTYMVTVMARDPLGASASIPVTIMVTNVDEAPEIMRALDANVAPEFASATTSRTVAENTAAGEDIGNPVAANDANSDALTYALSGTDAASFDIDMGSGQLMTLAALDYETKATYSVTVTASDSGGLSDSIDVTITVTNVDEMEPQPGTVLERYDYNSDGKIDQAEVEDALDDYFFGQPRLSQEDVEDVLELYFFP